MLYLRYYTRKDLDGFAAKAYAFVILIHVDYKNDRGLLEHEKIHVEQFWKIPYTDYFTDFQKVIALNQKSRRIVSRLSTVRT